MVVEVEVGEHVVGEHVVGRVGLSVLLTIAVALAAVVTGCGAVDSRQRAAARLAGSFRLAVADHDGARACALLAPETRREVEQTEERPCARAILAADLSARGGDARRTDVYGDQARVVFRDDTVFLAMFHVGWRVTAAGCKPRGERPYDCKVKGG